MKVQVQVVKNGGENNLHTHTGEDAFWYVISGAVKFYGEGDKLIGEYQKGEGIVIPRGFKYWIKRASAAVIKNQAVSEGMKTLRMVGIDKAREGVTTLEEILRVTAKDQSIDNKRLDLSPQKQWMIDQNTFGTRQ